MDMAEADGTIEVNLTDFINVLGSEAEENKIRRDTIYYQIFRIVEAGYMTATIESGILKAKMFVQPVAKELRLFNGVVAEGSQYVSGHDKREPRPRKKAETIDAAETNEKIKESRRMGRPFKNPEDHIIKLRGKVEKLEKALADSAAIIEDLKSRSEQPVVVEALTPEHIDDIRSEVADTIKRIATETKSFDEIIAKTSINYADPIGMGDTINTLIKDLKEKSEVIAKMTAVLE
jgi:hypothetical protein